MAVVYLARDLRHDRPVALKVLLPELAATPGQRAVPARDPLRRPAPASPHPDGARLRRVTTPKGAGQLWFTMPFVDGESLRDRLRREGRLPLEDALRITSEAARGAGLRAPARRDPPRHQAREHPAHPGRHDPGGRLRDRARAGRATTEPHAGPGIAHRHAGLHEPGADGRRPELDARTDLYSLACGALRDAGRRAAVHRADACRRSWPSGSPSRRPACGRSGRTVPDGVDEAIQKAMALAPADRFATVAEFARRCSGAWERGRCPRTAAVPGRPASAQRRRRRIAAVHGRR